MFAYEKNLLGKVKCPKTKSFSANRWDIYEHTGTRKTCQPFFLPPPLPFFAHHLLHNRITHMATMIHCEKRVTNYNLYKTAIATIHFGYCCIACNCTFVSFISFNYFIYYFHTYFFLFTFCKFKVWVQDGRSGGYEVYWRLCENNWSV